jgi:hypothetical protein
MRKINDVEHAIDQREAQRDQCIDCADQQTVEDRWNQDGGGEHGRDVLQVTAAGGAFSAPPAAYDT